VLGVRATVSRSARLFAALGTTRSSTGSPLERQQLGRRQRLPCSAGTRPRRYFVAIPSRPADETLDHLGEILAVELVATLAALAPHSTPANVKDETALQARPGRTHRVVIGVVAHNPRLLFDARRRAPMSSRIRRRPLVLLSIPPPPAAPRIWTSSRRGTWCSAGEGEREIVDDPRLLFDGHQAHTRR